MKCFVLSLKKKKMTFLARALIAEKNPKYTECFSFPHFPRSISSLGIKTWSFKAELVSIFLNKNAYSSWTKQNTEGKCKQLLRSLLL